MAYRLVFSNVLLRCERIMNHFLFHNLSLEAKASVKVNLFHQLGVTAKLCRCLAAQDILVPTLIQHEVLPSTFTPSQHCVIHSPTGSGKTLTFLLPALQDASPGLHSLIIVPSRELAIQIGHTANKLISRGKLPNTLLTLYFGEDDSAVVRRNVLPNVVVGTPKRVLELVNSKVLSLKSLRRIVLDEADKLLPMFDKKKLRDHEKPTLTIMNKAFHHGRGIQCIASSATITEDLLGKLTQCGLSKDHCLISTSEVESLVTPRSIEHGYIVDSASVDCNKLDILASYLRRNPGKSMIVIHRNAPISTFMF